MTSTPTIDEATLNFQDRLAALQAGKITHEAAEPEVVIFHKKLLVANRLLKIPAESLQNLQAQSWYAEYIALLSICIKNSALLQIAREHVQNFLQWYAAHMKDDSREAAVLAMIQFADPMQLPVPFNQHLLSKTVVDDIRATFLNYYPSVTYSDDDIAAYYLARQNEWRHGQRKMRVVFIVQSHVTYDKFQPVYEAMKLRDDIEPLLVVSADANGRNSPLAVDYFRKKYPADKIFDTCGVMDLRRLEPDYVIFANPYENMRPFRGILIDDVVKFAKVCVISYGATLAYNFAYRLFDNYRSFYRNVRFMFASAETVKTVMEKKFRRNVEANNLHVEFFGYPALKNFYRLEREPSDKKRILWTPRWSPTQKADKALIGGSHFMEFKDKFVALNQRYGDKVELFFRPHINLFRELIAAKIMSKDQVVAYRKALQDNHVTRHADLAELDKNIRNVDIFIADYSSILVELFLTGRPIIYCPLKSAEPLPEYADMFAAMYTARTWKDVERYLDDLLAGNDPLLTKRLAVAEKIFAAHKDAAEKIIDRLARDFADSLSIDD